MLLTRVFLLVLMMGAGSSICAAGDPTRPPIFGAPKAHVAHEPLKLSMILKDRDNMRAIINESVVGVSGVVAGARVIAIKDDYVVLSRAGQKITLRMPLADVRKDRSDD